MVLEKTILKEFQDVVGNENIDDRRSKLLINISITIPNLFKILNLLIK